MSKQPKILISLFVKKKILFRQFSQVPKNSATCTGLVNHEQTKSPIMDPSFLKKNS